MARRTRPQFREWATRLAAEYGYEVSFDKIGHAINEAAAVASLLEAGKVPAADIGASSQVSHPLGSGQGQVRVIARVWVRIMDFEMPAATGIRADRRPMFVTL